MAADAEAQSCWGLVRVGPAQMQRCSAHQSLQVHRWSTRKTGQKTRLSFTLGEHERPCAVRREPKICGPPAAELLKDFFFQHTWGAMAWCTRVCRCEWFQQQSISWQPAASTVFPCSMKETFISLQLISSRAVSSWEWTQQLFHLFTISNLLTPC